MVANSTQLTDLISAIYAKTMAGQLSWSRSAERGKFQTRVGDFLIQITNSMATLVSSPEGTSADYLQITVSKIDGQIVEVAGGGNALMTNRSALSSQDKQKLKEIYVRLSTTNQDLDELLKLLK